MRGLAMSATLGMSASALACKVAGGGTDAYIAQVTLFSWLMFSGILVCGALSAWTSWKAKRAWKPLHAFLLAANPVIWMSPYSGDCGMLLSTIGAGFAIASAISVFLQIASLQKRPARRHVLKDVR